MSVITRILTESWLVFTDMAPYLWLGFLVAGVLSVLLSPTWLERHLGGRGMGPVFKASLFGVPLPLCSCAVIPVSASLRHHGASRAATTAFLLSTPQTGVDSILVTGAMLGPVFAIYRPVAALLTGILGGGLVQLADGSNPRKPSEEVREKPECSDDCCSSAGGESRGRRILRYGLVTLPRDIGGALLLGVLIAGALSALVPARSLEAYLGGGILSILLLMAAGVPLYVCATASVPIAAGFMHLGASPGAALAFLIAGPATNAATLTTVWKVMGRRTAFIYLFTVATSAVGFGLLLNWLVPRAAAAMPQLSVPEHHHGEPSWLAHVVAVALLGVLLYSYFSRWRSGSPSTAEVLPMAKEHAGSSPGATPAVDAQGNRDRLELAVTGMNCDHCRQSVLQAITACAGVDNVVVDLNGGWAVVQGQEMVPQAILTAVEGAGFSARTLPTDDSVG